MNDDLLARRTIDVAPDVTVEIRVSRATAEQWHPELRDRVLSAAADGGAVRRMHVAVRERCIGAGRWVATFVGERVDLQPAGEQP